MGGDAGVAVSVVVQKSARGVAAALSLGVAVIMSGCASAGSTASPDAEAELAAPPPPCTVSVPSDEPWREVRGNGFTFCVPASWRATGRSRDGGPDASTWRGGGGSITWGTGAQGPRRVFVSEVTVRAGQPLPDPPGRVSRFTEVIGGRRAQLWNNEFDGKHFTGATWTQPALYLEGEASDAGAARLQLEIYRTVRFAEP